MPSPGSIAYGRLAADRQPVTYLRPLMGAKAAVGGRSVETESAAVTTTDQNFFRTVNP